MKQYKWIQYRPGCYKIVALDDPRPEDEPVNKKGIPNIINKLPWVSTVENLLPDPNKMDARAEEAAGEAMYQERQRELQASRHARSWEAGRRKEWAQNKKYWKKDRAHKKEMEVQKIIKEIAS